MGVSRTDRYDSGVIAGRCDAAVSLQAIDRLAVVTCRRDYGYACRHRASDRPA